MIIITITPFKIIVEAMQTGIKYHIETYSKSEHSIHRDIDAKRFYIKKDKKIVFECYIPIVMSVGI